MLFRIYKEIFNKKALIVDDHEVNLITYSYLLERQKMKTYQASSGSEALRLLGENPDIDVILMDIFMPEMDGFETIKRVRSNTAWTAIPIIAVTAKKGLREKCLENGANEYINKPLDHSNLMPILVKLLKYGNISSGDNNDELRRAA